MSNMNRWLLNHVLPHNERLVIIVASCREKQSSELTTAPAVTLRAYYWVKQDLDIKD